MNQRIQHHQRTKDENVRLAGQLRALQEERLKLSSRQAASQASATSDCLFQSDQLKACAVGTRSIGMFGNRRLLHCSIGLLKAQQLRGLCLLGTCKGAAEHAYPPGNVLSMQVAYTPLKGQAATQRVAVRSLWVPMQSTQAFHWLEHALGSCSQQQQMLGSCESLVTLVISTSLTTLQARACLS